MRPETVTCQERAMKIARHLVNQSEDAKLADQSWSRCGRRVAQAQPRNIDGVRARAAGRPGTHKGDACLYVIDRCSQNVHEHRPGACVVVNAKPAMCKS